MEPLNILKSEGERIQAEVRERTAAYIMSGLGVVVGLAWNEVVKGLIEYFIPFAGAGTLIAKTLYAVVLTLVIVLVATYLFKAPKK